MAMTMIIRRETVDNHVNNCGIVDTRILSIDATCCPDMRLRTYQVK